MIEATLFFFEALFQVADGLIHAITYPFKNRESHAENEAGLSAGVAMIKLHSGSGQ